MTLNPSLRKLRGLNAEIHERAAKIRNVVRYAILLVCTTSSHFQLAVCFLTSDTVFRVLEAVRAEQKGEVGWRNVKVDMFEVQQRGKQNS